jgi:acyl-CoA thioester hydrolase
VSLRWTDLDAYGHVNNAALVRVLEEARIEAFWEPPADQVARGAVRHDSVLGLFATGSPLLTVVGSQHLVYHRPIPYLREGVLVRLWISRMGGASFDVDYQVLRRDDAGADAPFASARATIVVVTRQDNRASRISPADRERLRDYVAEPLALRT